MATGSPLRAKTYFLLVLLVAFNSLGNILLSSGMKEIGAVDRWSVPLLAAVFAKTFTSVIIWLGIGSLLLFFVSFLLVLSWADFSYVLPASAAGYAVVPLIGYLLLDEVVTLTRWLGVALICLGVALVSRTPPSTVDRG